MACTSLNSWSQRRRKPPSVDHSSSGQLHIWNSVSAQKQYCNPGTAAYLSNSCLLSCITTSSWGRCHHVCSKVRVSQQRVAGGHLRKPGPLHHRRRWHHLQCSDPCPRPSRRRCLHNWPQR
ncbi:hypothetical protein VTI74DRAFT_2312 [Chaetomium olivicolor]